MREYITKQDAIKAITELPDTRNGFSGTYDKACIISTIEGVSSVDVVERRRGHWIRVPMACYGGGTITEYHCTLCEVNQIATSSFCPNCGADMGGAE